MYNLKTNVILELLCWLFAYICGCD